MLTATETITRPVAPAVPAVPAEQLDKIPTAPKRLAAHKIDRTPSTSGETRKGRATASPRAWVMGGAVD